MTWPPPPHPPNEPPDQPPPEPTDGSPSRPGFEPLPPPLAHPYPPPWPDYQRARSSRGRRSPRVVALAAIAVLAVIAAVIVGVTLSGGDDGSQPNAAHPLPSGSTATSTPASSSSRPAGPAAAPCTAPSFLQHEVLSAQLTHVLQQRDQGAFLALATNAATKAAMQLWWANLGAIGFTTGGAEADLDDDAPDKNRQVYMNIGVHSPLDPTTADPGNAHKRLPNISASWYLLTTAPGTGCQQRISGWRGLTNVPWDLPEQLTVVKTAHSVVAGPRSAAATIRRIAPLAEKAARWDFQFFRHNNGGRYLHQTGFISFVPGTPAQAAGWFRGFARMKPKGWTADPAAFAGLTRPLPGVQLPDPTGLPPDTPAFTPNRALRGGSRVVISKTGSDEQPVGIEGVIAHEFVHDLLDPYDTGYYLNGQGVSAAAAEGAARWIEAYYYDSPTCYCVNKKTHKYPTAKAYLTAGVRSKFRTKFHGSLPTNSQVYGTAKDANYYYDLSATTFDYLATKGTAFGLQCAVDAYVNGGGPFDGVFAGRKGGAAVFKNPGRVEKQWATWIRAQLK